MAVLQQEEGVPRLSAEKEQLKQQDQKKDEQVSRLQQEVQELKAQVSLLLSAENQWLKQQSQEKNEEETSRLLQELEGQGSPLQQEVQDLKAQVSCLSDQNKGLKEQVSRLSAENQQLKQQFQERDKQVSRLLQAVQELEGEVSHLQQQNQRKDEQMSHLQQEVQEHKKGPEASGAQQTTRWLSWVRSQILPAKDIIIEVRMAGKTGGCEMKLLEDVSERLAQEGVSLKVRRFTERLSEHLLLVFCPIASRMVTDIENALEGLSGEQKVLLVVMHFIPKDNPGPFVDAQHRVPHPAVHTRFTLKDGFYPCQMNETAVADVAAALKALAEDQ
nr:involucrin-like [Pogona vitticeps]